MNCEHVPGYLSQNVRDQRLATKGSSTPPGFIASLLHRVVLLSGSYQFIPSQVSLQNWMGTSDCVDQRRESISQSPRQRDPKNMMALACSKRDTRLTKFHDAVRQLVPLNGQ